MTPILFIISVIASLNITKVERTKLTACTLYGTRKIDKVSLIRKFQKCKKEVLK